MHPSTRRMRGFSAVEVAIVIAILSLLAAVAIPQIAARKLQGQTTDLVSHLGLLRSAVNRYWTQHDGFPGPDLDRIRQQLTGQTTRAGECGTGEEFPLGPYLPADIPESPVTGTNTLKVVDAMPPCADGSSAWIYCRLTGEVRCNTAGKTDDGIPYFDL